MIIHDVSQGSDAWLKLRCKIPTASKFSKIITSTGAPSKSMVAYAYSKVCESFAGQQVDPFAGNDWTDAGTEDEEAARDHYSFTTGYEVTQVGFITDGELVDGKPVGVTCGCSPDALVNDDGMLELKRKKGDLLVESNVYYNAHKKLLPRFVQQTQGQMWICGRKWCDTVIYNPLLPPLIIRTTPDPKIIAALKVQIAACNKLRDETLLDLKW